MSDNFSEFLLTAWVCTLGLQNRQLTTHISSISLVTSCSESGHLPTLASRPDRAPSLQPNRSRRSPSLICPPMASLCCVGARRRHSRCKSVRGCCDQQTDVRVRPHARRRAARSRRRFAAPHHKRPIPAREGRRWWEPRGRQAADASRSRRPRRIPGDPGMYTACVPARSAGPGPGPGPGACGWTPARPSMQSRRGARREGAAAPRDCRDYAAAPPWLP